MVGTMPMIDLSEEDREVLQSEADEQYRRLRDYLSYVVHCKAQELRERKALEPSVEAA